ncbi:MAG: ABC transporter ATP-binding protein [Candidatus Eisenbacteria bacterium]
MIEGTAAIAWRGVSKRYGAVQALDDLGLEIAPGEVFGFLGPNGAGKSTAIKIAAGLARPDGGEVLLRGVPAARPESRVGVGYLPEDLRFPKGFRLGEWLRVQTDLRGADPGRIGRMAERTGLSGRLKDDLAGFSKGMRRRAALTLLLVQDPEVWLLDEPTADLDVAGREMVENIVFEARSRGAAFFLSSHILSEVERVCDRVGIIGKGRLEKTARPAELLPAPFILDLTFPASPEGAGLFLGGRSYVLSPEARRVRVFVRDREDGNAVAADLEAAGHIPAESLFRPASLRDALGEVRT